MNISLDGLRELIRQSGQQELIIHVICIAGILIALANCFAGYRLLEVWITLLGIGLGAVGGYFASAFITDSAVIRACAVILAACVLGVLARWLAAAGTVLLCGIMAFSFSYYMLFYTLGYSNTKALLIIAVLAGVLCGLLAWLLKKPAIILITGICGAYTACSSTSSLLGIYYNPNIYWMIIGIVAALGIFTQFFTGRGNRSHQKKR